MKLESNINYFAVVISRLIAVFVVLLLMKVCENGFLQDVSWWWITLPIWAPAGVYLICLLVALIAWFRFKNDLGD